MAAPISPRATYAAPRTMAAPTTYAAPIAQPVLESVTALTLA